MVHVIQFALHVDIQIGLSLTGIPFLVTLLIK